MKLELTPYAIPLVAGVLILLLVMAVAWRRRSTRGASEFLGMSAFIAVYALAYAFEISSVELRGVQFWLKVEYIGVVFAPAMMLAVVLHYGNAQRLLTPVFYVLVSIIPILTLSFAWTNESSHLIWRNMHLDRTGGFTRTLFDRGGWYMVQIIYLYILSYLGIYMLYRAHQKARAVYRQQLRILLAALILPTLVHLSYIFRIPPEGLDVNPYTLMISALIIAWGIFDYQLLDVMPVAREAVLQGMNEAVIVLDASNRVVYLNPTAQQLIGVTRDESVGRPAHEVFAKWADIARQHGNAGETRVEIEVDINGTPRVFDMRQSALRTNRGMQQGRLYVLRDITERKAIMNELTQRNQQLTALSQFEADLARKLDLEYVLNTTIDAAVVIARPDVVAVLLSSPGEDEFSIARMWVGGNSIAAAPNLKVSSQIKSLVRVMATQQAEIMQPIAPPEENYLYAASQSRLIVPLVSADKLNGVLICESEKPGYFTPEMRDMLWLLMPRIAMAVDNALVYEERRKLVEELEAFAHTVAHDLKNPLASITGAADILRDPRFDLQASANQELLGSINRNASKATQIVNALLMLAGVRIASHFEVSPLNTEAILREVLRRLEYLIQQRQATITVAKSWPIALGYEQWVEEIWINYLSNAIKYGGQPPVIELGYDTPRYGQIRFWVKDNGPGLTHDQQRRLFQPFTRLTQARIEGHGLGLSIVQRIAERLQGEVGVESEVGQGSCFYFTLPAVSIPAEQPAHVKAS